MQMFVVVFAGHTDNPLSPIPTTMATSPEPNPTPDRRESNVESDSQNNTGKLLIK